MAKLHTCEVTDSVGDTHIFRDRSLRELMGGIGPAWPIKLDGVPGALHHVGNTDEIRFRPTR